MKVLHVDNPVSFPYPTPEEHQEPVYLSFLVTTSPPKQELESPFVAKTTPEKRYTNIDIEDSQVKSQLPLYCPAVQPTSIQPHTGTRRCQSISQHFTLERKRTVSDNQIFEDNLQEERDRNKQREKNRAHEKKKKKKKMQEEENFKENTKHKRNNAQIKEE